MVIFDKLTLKDLINMSTLNARFQQIVSLHYVLGKYDLGHVPITIILDDTVSMVDHSGQTFAAGYKQTVWVLQQFGHHFGFIQVRYGAFGSDESHQITHHIHTHCPDALRDIVIAGLQGDRLENWPVRFERVRCLTITDVPVSESLRLDRVFPRLEQLVLKHVADIKFLRRHFPSLLGASIRFAPNINASADLLQFIRLNPQIQALGTPLLPDSAYLASVNAMLPHLQSLALFIQTGAELTAIARVHFERVQNFAVFVHDADDAKMVVHHILPALHFDRLEQCEISAEIDGGGDDDQPIRFPATPTNATDASDDVSTATDESPELTEPLGNTVDELVELVARNKRLKNVTINRTALTYGQLTYLVRSLPALDELRIDWNQLPSLYEIRRFLMDPTHVRRVTIPVFGSGWGSKHIFQILPADWRVSEVKVVKNRKLLLLTRVDAAGA